MIRNSVIIATNASFLADILREKLWDIGFNVLVVRTDDMLAEKIITAYPRFIFIESCYHGYETDAFIQRLVKDHGSLHITVWTAAELKPIAAARFILAGAESFFSLRDSVKNIETILDRIAAGNRYCPAEVELITEREYAVPVIGEVLTQREIEVVKLAFNGKNNPQIAKVLSISRGMVKLHKTNVYRKCGGNSPIEILINVLKKGFISLDEL